MNALQAWIFNFSCLFLALIILSDLLLGYRLKVDSQKLAHLQIVIDNGQQANQLTKRMAVRVYQLSQNDFPLQQLMLREGILVQNPPATSPTPTVSPPTPTPTPQPSPLTTPPPAPTKSL